MESLQTKIKECLPQMKVSKDATDIISLTDGNPVPRGNNLEDSLYNLALLDVHSSIPKVIEIVREDEREKIINRIRELYDIDADSRAKIMYYLTN